MRLNFTLALKSDYHIGAGHGLGSQVDSALLRDSDGVPVLRGSTIAGLLRDGLWRLLQSPLFESSRKCEESGSLQEGCSAYCHDDACPLCRIFGTPKDPKRWRFSSARPAGAQKPLVKALHWSSGQTGAQVAARVRMDPRLRRAEERKLFKQEEGDGRLTFIFNVSCPVNDASAHDEAAMLVAAARMVRRFGSARRRGRGACTLSLDSVEGWHETTDEEWQSHLLGYFQERWLSNQRPTISVASTKWDETPESASDCKRFRLLVRADEPIVIARRAEAGNIFDGVDFISGATLLGTLAEEAASRWDLKSNRQFYKTFLNLFRYGHARFSPLFPLNHEKERATIPAPLDLLVCKNHKKLDEHNQGQIASYAVKEVIPDECSRCAIYGSSVPLTSLNEFLTVRDGVVALRTVLREEMHPRIDPGSQRVKTGNLFGYIGLESGLYFFGEIWCKDESTWRALRQLTGVVKKNEPFQLRLGKATRRGYGLVTAHLTEIESLGEESWKGRELDYWRGKPLDERVADFDKPITLTLLTDAILPDAWGRFHQTFDAELLKELIGAEFIAQDGKPIQVFCKSGYIDSFNNHLGLPRWRDIALKAGSAVGFNLKQPPDDEAARWDWHAQLLSRLRKLEEDGIGLRRHEGFGRVVFNHPVYDDGQGVSGTDIKIPETLRLADKLHKGAARDLREEEEVLRQWERGLRKDKGIVNIFCKAADKKPTNEEERNWGAVARWLHNEAGQTIERLKEQLNEFGKASVLTEVLRDKENFFEAKGKSGVEYLNKKLDEIAAKNASHGTRRRMIELLTDRLRGAVRKGEEQ